MAEFERDVDRLTHCEAKNFPRLVAFVGVEPLNFDRQGADPDYDGATRSGETLWEVCQDVDTN